MRAMPSTPSAALTTRPGAAYPAIDELRSMVQFGHHGEARALLADREAAERTTILGYGSGGFGGAEASGGDIGMRRASQAAVDADPQDAFAAVLLGGNLIDQAWKVRSADLAQFRTLLCEAERLLTDAVTGEPPDCAGWVFRLSTARGLSLGQAEARRRYDRLAEIDPHHLPGQVMLLQQLCPTWGGSFADAHAFARSAMLAAPEGALNAVLVVDAHLEQVRTLPPKGRTRHLADERVREQIREAAARSVEHPDFRRTSDWVRVCNSFAMMLGLIGDHAAAARQFDAVGPHVSRRAWEHLGDPVTVFRTHRDRALRARAHAAGAA
jgi:hypothetical protein